MKQIFHFRPDYDQVKIIDAEKSTEYDTWKDVKIELIYICICINFGLHQLADIEIYISYKN